MIFGKTYKISYQPVVLNGRLLLFNTKGTLHYIKYITGDLGGQHGKVVGNDDEQDTQEKPVPVLPEIRIKRF